MKYIKENLYLILLSATALLAVAAISPRGNFPLNDDWVYGYSVKHFFDTGELRLSEWVAPTTVAHVWWGLLWCKIFGFFSFTVLRCSTLFLSFSGAAVFYLILKKSGCRNEAAAAGAGVLFFNPMWFVLSYTFMTDVTYLAVCFISIYLYYLGVKEEKESYYILGSVFASFAYLIRQIGIIVPVSVIIYLFLFKKLDARKIILVSFAAIFTVLAHRYWLKYIHGYTWAYVKGEDLKIAFDELPSRLAGSLFYVGLYTLPLNAAIYAARSSARLKNDFKAAAIAFVVGITLILFVASKGQFPYFENVINAFGLGTITLAHSAAKARGVLESIVFWKLVTLASGFSAVYFIYVMFEQIFSESRMYFERNGFFFLVFLLQFLAAVSRYKFFDRYTLLLLPLGIIVSLEAYRKISAGHEKTKVNGFLVAFPLILVFAVYSIVGTADYMSWNKAKWELGGMLVKKGYAVPEIANGLDWDGWFTFEQNMKKIKTYKPVKTIGEWDWQAINNYKCAVSFEKPPLAVREILSVVYKTPFSRKECLLYAWPR